MPQAQDGVRHSFDNYSSELDAMDGDDVDLDIRPTSRNIRGRNPANDQDGAEGPRKKEEAATEAHFRASPHARRA